MIRNVGGPIQLLYVPLAVDAVIDVNPVCMFVLNVMTYFDIVTLPSTLKLYTY